MFSEPSPDDAVTALDDPVGESLRSRHRHLARRHASALGYVPEVASFVAVRVEPHASDWADLAVLLGRGGLADLFSSPAKPPPGWEPVFHVQGLQLVGPVATVASDDDGPRLVDLAPADVPEMLDLAARTRPGPFFPGTVAMGAYVGVREHGRLVAMAGERLRPPGWTEISAVCTDPDATGRGFATRLVRRIAAGILARGDRPFLHVAADNAAAIALYQRLGFVTRRRVTFRGFRVP